MGLFSWVKKRRMKREYMKRCIAARVDTPTLSSNYPNIRTVGTSGRTGRISSGSFYLKKDGDDVLVGGMYNGTDGERVCYALAIAMAQLMPKGDLSVYSYVYTNPTVSRSVGTEIYDLHMDLAEIAVNLLIPYDLAREIHSKFDFDDAAELFIRGFDVPNWCVSHRLANLLVDCT